LLWFLPVSCSDLFLPACPQWDKSHLSLLPATVSLFVMVFTCVLLGPSSPIVFVRGQVPFLPPPRC
jgi:hypothetical protein